MKKIFILISIIIFNYSNALAVTLYDALNQTFKNNTQLNAERENLKASEEDINISNLKYLKFQLMTFIKLEKKD